MASMTSELKKKTYCLFTSSAIRVQMLISCNDKVANSVESKTDKFSQPLFSTDPTKLSNVTDTTGGFHKLQRIFNWKMFVCIAKLAF